MDGEWEIPEPELRQPPPRPVRWTATARRLLVRSVALPAAALLGVGWTFLREPQTAASQALFALFATLGLFLIVNGCTRSLHRARLVSAGHAARGVIVQQSATRRGQAAFGAWFSADGRQFLTRWTAPDDSAEIGDAVTVLYLPDDPERSLPYEETAFRAVYVNGHPPPSPFDHAAGPEIDHSSPLTPRI